MNTSGVPCKGCKLRRVGCHSDCVEYLTYAKEKDEIREKRRKETEILFTTLKLKEIAIKRRRSRHEHRNFEGETYQRPGDQNHE
jgi:hypothetical protein